MKDLYFSELRRFRWIAMAAAVANQLLLIFLNRIGDLLQNSYFHGLLLLIAMVSAVALAIFQVGSYRKPSQWAWLIHRPLSTSRIFGALALSATTILSLVILLPMLIVLISTDILTTRVADLHHYVSLLHVLAFSMMAWMAGAHACISRSRVAIAVLFAPLLLALHMVSVFVLLLPVSLALGWLSWITLKSFRANREGPIHGSGTLLLTTLPLQIGLFLLCLVLVRFLMVSGGILLGTDPLNTDYPPKGGLIETERSEPSEEFVLGLAESDDPRAESWRTQMPLLEPLRFGPWLKRFPVRHQFSKLPLPSNWYDKERNIFWSFSHDRMLFVGRNPESGVAQGVFGMNGGGDDTPFASVPVVAEHGDLLTTNTLYGIDEQEQSLFKRFELSEGEIFTALPQRELGRLLLLTNQRLIVLREDRRAAATIPPLLLDWEVNLPDGPQHMESVSVAELMDGWLVSFVYSDGMRQIGLSQFPDIVPPWQQVIWIDTDGNTEVVAERRIEPDFPVLQRSFWWLSPTLEVLTTWPEVALDKGLTWPMKLKLVPAASSQWIAAALLILLSVIAAWWWLRKSRIPVSRQWLWIASCAVIGLPALLSMFLLEPRERQA
ncbi:hypothetical protein [Kangiella koreensis]|uniref:Uncharacterized protein n=1 Tax=Kangiella koreensis (strain DSM 16069 / JCM 12317 / KCTC 12182 / SW-125) TaxID=523791 RepID=C7R679_KANKD|nr:hypothetical protein [Kangiella koreensis]ACV25510.1 hypothetical protein Kkor_0088 [Kangiella koreensis DSM 16069]